MTELRSLNVLLDGQRLHVLLDHDDGEAVWGSAHDAAGNRVEVYLYEGDPYERVPVTANGRDFGRIAARDGWTLDSARHLGALTGFDPADVEAGYRCEHADRPSSRSRRIGR